MTFDPLFDPDATPEDVDALKEKVRRDPEAAETAARLLYVDGLLWASARKIPAKRRRWPWILASAGTAAAAVILALLLHEPSGATIESATGTVASDRDSVRTSGASSSAVVVYPDGTRLDVGGDTTVTELNSRRVQIAKGTVRAVVAPQQKPLAFVTPHGEAKILGTTLRLAVDKETRLEVEEGKVELKNLASMTVIVTSGRYAVAAAGAGMEVKPIRSAAAALLEKMASRRWLQIPGTTLRSVAPDPEKLPKIRGGIGVTGVIESWSGGVLDTRRERLIVWGGGASNYFGNEVYAFDIATSAWLRLTEPTEEPTLARDAGIDGRPTARSTYNGLAYVAHLDRMFAQGGSLAGNNGRADRTWMFDFATQGWLNRNPPSTPGGGFGSTASYDPVTRKVWWGNADLSFAGLWSYDVDSNVWTKHTADDFADVTSAIDTKRGLLVFVGRNEVFSYDLRSGAPKKQPWTTTGGAEFIARSGVGLDYDPSRDRLVGWHGGPVFELDPESKAWTRIDAPGAPDDNRNGVYGRWRYVPGLRAFVVVTKVDGNVHFYKP